MSFCPAITNELGKCQKHFSNIKVLRFPSELLFGTVMFTFDMKPVFPVGIYEIMIEKMVVFSLFQLSTRLNSRNPLNSEINNEFGHINLYMNNGISNWHI